MAAYTDGNMFTEALYILERSNFSCPKVDSYTHPRVLKACNGFDRGDYDQMVHTRDQKWVLLY